MSEGVSEWRLPDGVLSVDDENATTVLEWRLPGDLLMEDEIVRKMSDEEMEDYLSHRVREASSVICRRYEELGGRAGKASEEEPDRKKYSAENVMNIVKLMSLGYMAIEPWDILSGWDKPFFSEEKLDEEAMRRREDNLEIEHLVSIVERLEALNLLVLSCLRESLGVSEDETGRLVSWDDDILNEWKSRKRAGVADWEIKQQLEDTVLAIHLDAYMSGVPVEDILA